MATIGTNEAFDSTKAQAFGGQFLAALNSGALCLMTSIGHRTGLFDAMRALPPSTSAEIATKAVSTNFQNGAASNIKKSPTPPM